MKAAVKNAIIAVLLLFFVYGFFFPRLPVVNADELWETSRGYYMKTHLKSGEPLLPYAVAPFYAAIEHMEWKGWFILTIKSGSLAAMMYLLPVDELIAMRYAIFLWSLLAILFTYLVARQFLLDKWYSLLAVAILIAIPDFFSQIHRERSEVMICACLMAGIYFFNKIMKIPDEKKKTLSLFFIGIIAWLPSFLIHPSSIVIPGVLGIVYLINKKKDLFTAQTLLFGIGLIIGASFFIYIMNEIKEYAVAAGGGNYFQYQGPPMFVKGWKYVISIPYAFYNKFMVSNILSRPVSFLVFVFGFVLFFLQIRGKTKVISDSTNFITTGVAIFFSLTILYLLSGSFGNYNVIVSPFIAILIASFFSLKEQSEQSNNKKPVLLLSFLLMVFTTNALGIKEDVKMAKEYTRITSYARSKIDDHSPVLGLALYYNPFKDQPYYSNSWFNPYGGRPDQSFEDAVKALKVKYVIIDDAFVGRALLDRGRPWTDSMFTYLKLNGEVVDEIEANYFVGNRVPDPEFYSEDWRFKEQKKKYIRRIRIVEITNN